MCLLASDLWEMVPKFSYLKWQKYIEIYLTQYVKFINLGFLTLQEGGLVLSRLPLGLTVGCLLIQVWQWLGHESYSPPDWTGLFHMSICMQSSKILWDSKCSGYTHFQCLLVTHLLALQYWAPNQNRGRLKKLLCQLTGLQLADLRVLINWISLLPTLT